MKLIAYVLLFCIISTKGNAQDLTNKGKDFWVGYGYHVNFPGNNAQEMVLYFATDVMTTITVSIPGLGYTKTYSNIPANSIFETDPIPKSGAFDARLLSEGLFATGIHVTADNPVVAYTHIYATSVSGASLLFPTNTLGKDYYSINYTQKSNAANSNGFFFVIAADTGTTTIEITPSASTLTHSAGNTFQVTLSQGQIYNVMGSLNGNVGSDLTGSRIRSISTGTNSCKRIAVFSGTGKMTINCVSGSGSADNFIAQAFPKSAWGKRFLTAPTRNMPNNYFRIAVSDSAAVVKWNGTQLSGLINKFYYDLPLTNLPSLIESDQPITVAQYITTANSCGNSVPGIPGDGDPEIIYLSPVEQTTDKIILNSTSHYKIDQHFVNLIVKTSAINSVIMDGASVSSSFSVHPGDPNYSYAQIPVLAGQHSIQADSGLSVIAYGYGIAESYGYNGGTNIKDLYQFISIINPNSIVNQPTACSGSPFYFSITLPYKPVSLFWNFHDANITNQSESDPLKDLDSTYTSNGKIVYRYKLPIKYFYKVGTYPITVIANNPTPDGCSGEQQINFDLSVFDPPVSNFYYQSNGCVNSSIQFRDTSKLNGRPAYKWFWDFGDGTTSTQKNPAHIYNTADSFKVKYSVITDIGCLSDTSFKTVFITNIPQSGFKVTGPGCLAKPLSFLDSSNLSGPGSISKWYWNFDDGQKDTLNSNATRLHAYPNLSTYHPSLIVESSSGCKSSSFSLALNIHPFPIVSFSLPQICLPGGVGQFFDSSLIVDSSQSQFKYLWDFGDPSSGNLNIDSVKNPNHTFNTSGPYNIKLQVTSKDGCASDSTETLNQIYPATKASFSVNAENCLNDSSLFTDQTVASQYPLVKWYWDFGDGQQDTLQNPKHLYGSPGNFTVTFYGITIKGCSTDTINKVVTINPLPLANFKFSTPDCATTSIDFTDQSLPNVGSINKWLWNFSNGQTSAIQNPSTTFSQPGTYMVTLIVQNDKGCMSAIDTNNLLINTQPVPGFISPEVCLSDAFAQFTDTSKVASGNITGWAWDFGDPGSGSKNISSNKNPQHRYNAIGNYPVMLTVTSNNNCVATLIQTITVNGDKPKSDFVINTATPACANDSVSFSDASFVNFGNITRTIIYWDNIGDPSKSDTDFNPIKGKIYKHLYSNFQQPLTKNYSIRYVVFSGASCVSEVTKSITVNSAPKVIFSPLPDICLDASPYQVTEANEIGGVPGTGVFTGNGISPSGLFTPANAGAGVQIIHFTFTSTAGCVDTASMPINVLVPPQANFTYSAFDCEKQDMIFTDSSFATADTITNWTWDFNDGTGSINKSSGEPFTHQFYLPGTYQVSLKVTTNNGCNSTVVIKNIVVHPLPVPDFSTSKTCLPNANAIFTNKSLISDGTQNLMTYSWDFGDPNSGSNDSALLKDPSHLYSAIGPYNVRLTAISSSGCTKDTLMVYNDIHPQPSASFKVSTFEGCIGTNIDFNDLSTGSDGTINAWTWNFGDGSSSTIQNPSHLFSQPGVFNVSLYVNDTNNCQSDTSSLNVTIDPYPTVNAKPDRFVLEGDTIVLSPQYSGTELTYLWTPPDNLSNDTVPNPVLTGVSDMTYTITVTGKGNCTASDKVFVKILKTPKVPNTFTPNNDGINDFWVIEDLQYYRNARVQVFDRNGRVVFESIGYPKPWDGNYKGTASPVPFGTYYYIIEPGNGRKAVTGYVTVLK